ncbi:Bgt-5329 [Blumeria graminis f. sp. tritici]|uniref:Bgt-5329 n=2 Tax=Blumeria graminis f. sp. tritici TaxID=62690 RepID=A0A381LDC6_BLUGR|nr:hypothetical protein BGT96224_5329 [Blumeria graminis f. sp. tritici 96224]VDB89136.1 Bgt-5329 [Blumeria graminis f. sp. tritici]
MPISTSLEDESQDVNDFLQRIKEIGQRRDQEDEERNRKLEEDIIQGRRERQARRAERARSISPIKSSPATTPNLDRLSMSLKQSFSESLQSAFLSNNELHQEKNIPNLSADEVLGSKKSSSIISDECVPVEPGLRGTPSISSMSNTILLRSPTLSWQRRPSSQASENQYSRKSSVKELEMATKSPSTTPSTSPIRTAEFTPGVTSKISNSKVLTNSQPESSYGINSIPPREVQLKEDRSETSSVYMETSNGINHDKLQEEPELTDLPDHSNPLSRYSSNDNGSSSLNIVKKLLPDEIKSPIHLTTAQTLIPPSEPNIEGRKFATSMPQGRISPERLDRSMSPTKGMGGFVQSAMMKRSDSVNKRWSVQSSPAPSRAESELNFREAISANRDNHSNIISKPGSTKDDIISTQERSNPPCTTRSFMNISTAPKDATKTSIPIMRSSTSQGYYSGTQNASELKQKETTPPSSPTKSIERRRWSPTKSSWLEAALNKPDSQPKHKAAVPLHQPTWKSELNRAKNSLVNDNSRSQVSAPKHEVNIGGLMRLPPMGSSAKPPTAMFPTGLPTGFTNNMYKPRPRNSISLDRLDASFSMASSDSSTTSTSTPNKVKSRIDKSPSIDLTAGSKSRDTSKSSTANGSDLKNVFVQLRPTKTQNYVAPDELKNNILRGKAALILTNGPQKSEIRDGFKEAILKKKEDFNRAQLEGRGVANKPVSNNVKSLPEALIKRKTLGRSGSTSDLPIISQHTVNQRLNPFMNSPKITSKSCSGDEIYEKSPTRICSDQVGLTARESSSSEKINDRFPSPTSEHPTITDKDSNVDVSISCPPLVHLTKMRARGPHRRAPTGLHALFTTVDASTLSRMGSTSEIQTNVGLDNLTPYSSIQGVIKSSNIKQSLKEFDAVREESSFQRLPEKNHDPGIHSTLPGLEPPANEDSSLGTPLIPQQEHINKQGEAEAQHKSILPSKLDQVNYVEISPSASTEYVNLQQPSISQIDNLMFEPQKRTVNLSEIHQREQVVNDNAGPFLFLDSEATISCRRPSSSLDSSYELISDDKYISRDQIQATTSVDFLPESLEHEKTISLSHSHNSLLSPKIINSSPTASIKNSEPHVISNFDKQALEVSDAPSIITDFFSENIPHKIFNLDIVETLSSYTDFALNIRTLEVETFQISNNGKKQQVPNHQKRILFEENQYYYIHKFMNETGQVFIKAYWWIGGQVPMILVEEAEKIAHTESRTAGAELHILQQGKETAEFIFALDGIIITHRGSSHKYDSLAPRVLCGRKYMGQIVFDEVDYSLRSLCSGFPYLISTNSGKCYLWKGKGSSVDELSCARLVGMEFGLTGEIEEIEDGKEPPSFIRLFNEDIEISISASYWEMKPKCCRYRVRLFVSSAESKDQVSIQILLPPEIS